METLLQDIRFGLRMLRKNPGFTTVAVLTLALGIGVNVAIFSYVDELWLRPIPVRDAAQLVRVFTSNPSSKGEIERGYSSYPDFQDIRSQSKALSGVALMERRGALLDDGTQNLLVTAAVLSDNFFDVLQPAPASGRNFTEQELTHTHALTVMLSYPFWQSQFNADAALVGRTIKLDHQQVAVAGILPRGFRGTEPMQVPNVWIPISTWVQLVPGEVQRLNRRDFRDYELFARLKENVAAPQANAEAATLSGALAQQYPATNKGRRITVIPEIQARGEWTQQVGLILLGIGALVLLIASANVANLLLARSEHRRREIAARVALGASPLRIVRQLLAETAVLAAAGTIAALLLGNFVLHALPRIMPQTSVPAGVDAYLSSRVLLFGVMVGTLSVFLFGLVPALQAMRVAPASALKQSGLQATGSRGPLRNVLVAGQVALSLVLIVSAGLLVHSLINALQNDPGFNAHQNMLLLDLVPSFGTKSDQASFQFVAEARRGLEALPGVKATTVAMRVPFGMSGSGATKNVFVPGNLANRPEGVTINFDPVGDGYFQVLGTRLLRGRGIDRHDLEAQAHVVVVNQRLANRFWPNDDAVGKQIRLNSETGEPYEVIGVAEDGKYNDFEEDPMPYLYVPLPPDEYGELSLAVQTNIDPILVAPAVRRTLREINRDVPILAMVSMREHVREALYDQLILSRLIVTLGGLGLVLAAIGIYGLISFLVTRRTQEIGIRLALGASRSGIFRLVIGKALFLTLLGVAIGIAGSLAATQLLRGMLFGVSPTDMFAFSLAVFVLVAVAGLAALAPARRATRVDPMEALRYE